MFRRYKKLFIILAAVAVFIIAGGFILFQKSKVVISKNSNPKISEINVEDLEKIISEKNNFVLFVSQTGCRTADDLREILQNFVSQKQIEIYETNFSDARDKIPEIKFYPSVAIFKNGKIKSFLDANSSADSAAYLSYDGFEKWFSEHAMIKD